VDGVCFVLFTVAAVCILHLELLQLRKLKSPYTAEQAACALSRVAKRQIESDPSRKSRMHEYLGAEFGLQYVVPASLKGSVGWQDVWDDHVFIPTPECIQAVDKAADEAWRADKAIQDAFRDIDVDF
jgi:hypothetical protein